MAVPWPSPGTPFGVSSVAEPDWSAPLPSRQIHRPPAPLAGAATAVPALRSSHTCTEPTEGPKDQRVCVFKDVILFENALLYVADDPSHVSVPSIRYAWLSKYPGDELFAPEVVAPSDPRVQRAAAAMDVGDVPKAGLFHQQHYSNFYHMFSEMAPTFHAVICEHLDECEYNLETECVVWDREVGGEGWGGRPEPGHGSRGRTRVEQNAAERSGAERSVGAGRPMGSLCADRQSAFSLRLRISSHESTTHTPDDMSGKRGGGGNGRSAGSCARPGRVGRGSGASGALAWE